MPLLHVVGMAPTNQTFSACFAFMEAETEADYNWALSHVKGLFGDDHHHPLVIVTDRDLALMTAISQNIPGATNLLCCWHINKNIFANLRKHFGPAADWEEFLRCWNSVVNAGDEPTFVAQWSQLRSQYPGKISEYLEKTWICHKERFVRTWTNKVLHFGNLVTSRAEGKHAVIKKWISVSSGDLRDVYKKLMLSVEHQEQEIRRALAYDRATTRIPHQQAIWAGVRRKLSHYALNKVEREVDKARHPGPLPVCTGSFHSTLGLPCAHMIRDVLVTPPGQIRMDMFSRQWWLDQPTADDNPPVNMTITQVLQQVVERHQHLPLHQQRILENQIISLSQEIPTQVQEPVVGRTRGRPRGAKKDWTTRRELSAFERVEATIDSRV